MIIKYSVYLSKSEDCFYVFEDFNPSRAPLIFLHCKLKASIIFGLTGTI